MYVLQAEYDHSISNSIDLICYCAITELVMIRTSTSRTATRTNKNSDDQNNSTRNGECRLGSHNVKNDTALCALCACCVAVSVCSTHMQDLQEVTQEIHYENFRSDKLAINPSSKKLRHVLQRTVEVRQSVF